MSSVNFLEKLLDGVSVEWKSLGDICNIKTGPNINKNIISNNSGVYPVINSGRDPLGYVNVFNTENDPIGIASRGSVGLVSWTPGKYFRGNLNYSCTVKEKNKLDVRYLYHYLLHADAEIQALATHQGIPALNASALKTLQVPLVPLEIHAEIVRILDAMTAHTAELTAELTARKKQYNYFRDKLLIFEEGEIDVEWKTLGEVAIDFGRGKSKHRPRNDEKLYGGDIPFIQTGDIRAAAHFITEYTQTYSDFGLKQSKLWPKGTLCITIAANIAETSILGFDACFPDSVIGFVADPKKTSSGYVEYLLQTMKSSLEKKGKEKSSAQSNINLSTFEQLKLPFPSLDEQKRIVALLDKFEAITASITEGLPREIELRQKQYAYYRDLLLSFPQAQTA